MTDNPTILICYNEPITLYKNYIGKEVDSEKDSIDLSEKEFKSNLLLIENTLKKTYNNVFALGFDGNIKSVIDNIYKFEPDIVFNFVESIEGNAKFEIYVTGMFDILGIEYTGNSSLCLGNCLLKYRTKQLLKFNGINIPNYFISEYNKKTDLQDLELKYPMILKLVNEDASIGISEFSVIRESASLRKQLNFLFDNYQQNVMLEEYIEGREFNVSILGGEVLPISEINFKGLPEHLPKIVTYEAKWAPQSLYYQFSIPVCPANISEKQFTRIKNVALKAYNALGCRDYARVDIRMDKNNKLYVIEINPNPDISPDSGFVRSAEAAGISYEELLLKLVKFPLHRNGDDQEIRT